MLSLIMAFSVFSIVPFSVSAVEVNAAGTAEVTVAGTDGKTETKTFNVGDTFTVYTTMYSAQFDGKIASLLGTQDYTDSVWPCCQQKGYVPLNLCFRHSC